MIDRQFSQCLNVWWAEHLGDRFHSNYDPFGEKRYIFGTRNTSSRATFSSQRKEFIAKWDREVFRSHAKNLDDVWERKEIRFCYTYWAPFCGSPGCGARNKQEYFFSAQWRGRGNQNHSSRCCPIRAGETAFSLIPGALKWVVPLHLSSSYIYFKESS